MTKRPVALLAPLFFVLMHGWSQGQSTALVPARSDGCVRVATFNVSMNRKALGQLTKDLQTQNPQVLAIATIIRTIQPDVVLLNEIDWQAEADNAALLADLYLADAAPDMLGNGPWQMPFRYSASVNTGIDSGHDLNGNGKTHDPEDAWGFGNFPGQYGMAVLSRYPIKAQQVRTFQQLKWSSLPGALVPRDPVTQKPYYPEDIWTQLRVSSKSHWDVPISSPLGTLSILASHPTPPAFDGPADHNGCRNHDEIRLLADYIDQEPHDYLVDDQGLRGGIASDRQFVIVGDLNSDPVDGESRHEAIGRLLASPRISSRATPESKGAVQASQRQAQANSQQRSPSKYDTADFSDKVVGNLRVDYVLPSAGLNIVASGVFWLGEETAGADAAVIKKLMNASDHHLVWVDVK